MVVDPGQLKRELRPCLLVTLVLQVVFSSGFVSEPKVPCLIAAPEREAVDIVCKVVDEQQTCREPRVTWKKDSIEIKDSDSFGIWTAEWGVNKNEHVTLLRIRKFAMTDMGGYYCHVGCSGDVGAHERFAHACILQPGTNLISCNRNKKTDYCQTVFQDGICNRDCNHTSGLYDGFDFQRREAACPPDYLDYCLRKHGNGQCDRACDFSGCGFDGGDCRPAASTVVSRESVLVVAADLSPRELQQASRSLSKNLTVALRTMLHTLDDRFTVSLTDMSSRVYTWSESVRAVYYHVNAASRYDTDKARGMMYFKLGETCSKPGACFRDVSDAARFLHAKLTSGWDPNIPIYAIGVLTSLNKCSDQTSSILDNLPKAGAPNVNSNAEKTNSQAPVDYGTYIGAALGGVAVVVLVVGIICILKFNTKESRDHLEAPEGSEEPPVFEENGRPKTPEPNGNDTVTSPEGQTVVPESQRETRPRPVTVDGTVSVSAC